MSVNELKLTMLRYYLGGLCVSRDLCVLTALFNAENTEIRRGSQRRINQCLSNRVLFRYSLF